MADTISERIQSDIDAERRDALHEGHADVSRNAGSRRG